MKYGFLIAALAGSVMSQTVGAARRLDHLIQVSSVKIDVDGGNTKATVQLVNRSQKIVTGFTISATAHFADGKQETAALTRDILVSTLVDQKLGVAADLFGPGKMATATVMLPTSEHGAVVGSSAEVSMVAFDDNTAIGDNATLSLLNSGRANELQESSNMVADLQQLQSAPDRRQTMEQLIARAAQAKVSGKMADRVRAEHHESFLKLIAPTVQMHPEQISPYLEAWKVRMAVLRDHAALHQVEEDK